MEGSGPEATRGHWPVRMRADGAGREKGVSADDFEEAFGELQVALLVSDQELDLGLHVGVGDLLGEVGVGAFGVFGAVHDLLDEVTEHGLLKHRGSPR